MAKLQIIYNNWNEAQKKYYKDILEALLLNEVQTGNTGLNYSDEIVLI